VWVNSAAERLCPVWAALVRRRCGCLDGRVGDFTLSNIRNAANGGLLYRSPGFEIGRCGSEIPPTRPVWPEKVLTAPRPDEGGKASHLQNRMTLERFQSGVFEGAGARWTVVYFQVRRFT
jgi:hypothetical protein